MSKLGKNGFWAVNDRNEHKCFTSLIKHNNIKRWHWHSKYWKHQGENIKSKKGYCKQMGIKVPVSVESYCCDL